MTNHDGTVIARFTRITGLKDRVDNVQVPRGGKAKANDGVKETGDKGRRMELACLRYSTWRFSMSGAFLKLSLQIALWTRWGEKKSEEEGQEMTVEGVWLGSV